AGVVQGTRAGVAASARRVRRSTSEFAAVVTGRPAARGASGDGARRGVDAPEVEPLVRATHVEAPALDPDEDVEPDRLSTAESAENDGDTQPDDARAPFPRFNRPGEATPKQASDEAELTPQGNRRS